MSNDFDSEVFQAACDLAEAGVSPVFILDDGSKRPAYSWKQDQEQIPSLERLRQVYQDGFGLGMVTGEVSGNLEVIDSDEVSYEDFRDLCKLYECEELLRRLPVYTTGSYKRLGGKGGWQVCYRLPEPPPGNTKLAQFKAPAVEGEAGARQDEDGSYFRPKTAMETRGKGGYAAIPPTPAHCHEDNAPYMMRRGKLTEIPFITLDERELLHGLCRSFSEFVKPAPVVTPKREKKAHDPSGNIAPWDAYNDAQDYEGVLERAGWRRMRQRGVITDWQRPGKSDSGISGTTNHENKNRFFCFTSNAYPFEPETAYSPFDVYMHLECGGDKVEAIKSLSQKGFGTPYVKSAPKIAQPPKWYGEACELPHESPDSDADAQSPPETPGTPESGPYAPETGIPASTPVATGNEDEKPLLARAEAAVLSALLLCRETSLPLARKLRLTPDDFEWEMHRAFARALLSEREGVDSLLLESELVASGVWTRMDKPGEYLSMLAAGAAPENFAAHARMVRGAAARRRVRAELTDAESRIASGGDALAIAQEVSERVEKMRGDLGGEGKSHALHDVVDRLQENLRLRREHPELYPVYTTGHSDLDAMLGGLEPGLLYIVGARPSVGKTSLLYSFAEGVCGRQKKGGAVFSLESSEESIALRWGCAFSRVNSRKVRANQLDAEEQQRLNAAFNVQKRWQLHLEDTGALTVPEIEARCKGLLKTQTLGFVAIDYLSLIRSHERADNRAQEVGVVAKRLARMAKELNVPVIALAQINRAVESREVKRPLLSDLRESGDIEAAADVVIMLYREQYYAPKTNAEAVTPETVHETELIIAKNRDGATGVVKVGFLPYFSMMIDLDPYRDDEPTGF